MKNHIVNTIKKNQSENLWKTIYIFISSTFNDMHAERDLLVKRVFSELREWCEKRFLWVVDIDLRWGVTEEEACDNKNAVGVCLNHVDQCRPFFLCFLGQRYGWQPEKDYLINASESFPNLQKEYESNLSVTEYEIRHALLSMYNDAKKITGPKFFPVKNALIYKRKPDYIKQIPDNVPSALKRIYTDEVESDPSIKKELIKKQEELEKFIIKKNRIKEYTAQWSTHMSTPELELPLQCPFEREESIKQWQDNWKYQAGLDISGVEIPKDSPEALKAISYNESLCKGRLTDFYCAGKSLSDVVLQDLKKVIIKEFPERKYAADFKRESKNAYQNAFMIRSCEGYVERKGEFDDLNKYIADDCKGLFIISSVSGSGKTSFLSYWINNKIINNQSLKKIYRFANADDNSNTSERIIRSILEELKDDNLLNSNIPESLYDLQLSWISLVEEASLKKKIILIIDALDQLEGGLQDIAWLPGELPNNIKMVVSFKLEGELAQNIYDSYCELPQNRMNVIKPFELQHKQQMIHSYLKKFLKRLDDKNQRILLSLKGMNEPSCPLFLRIVLSELKVFGIFSHLKEEIENAFGQTPFEAFIRMLQRLENDSSYLLGIDNKNTVAIMMGSLAYSRNGLSKKELCEILISQLDQLFCEKISMEKAKDSVSLVLRQIQPFLMITNSRYMIRFGSLKEAIQKKYSKFKSNMEWHKIIGEYYYEKPVFRIVNKKRLFNLQKLTQLPYHLTIAEMWDKLESTLSDYDFLYASFKFGLFDIRMEDFQRINDEKVNPIKIKNTLRKFNSFIGVYGNILNLYPRLLFQSAYNQPDNSPIHNVSKQWLETGKISFSWLTLLNKINFFTPVNLALHQSNIDESLISTGNHYSEVLLVSDKNELILRDLSSGKVNLNKKPFEKEITSCAYSFDGKKIAFITDGVNFYIYSKTPFVSIFELNLPVYIDHIHCSKEFTLFAFISGMEIFIFNKNNEVINLKGGHIAKVNDCCFSNCGRWMASVGNDQSVHFWDLQTNEAIWFSEKHYDHVYSCDFSPSNKYLVTGSIEEFIVWDINKPSMIFRQPCHRGAIRSLKVLSENEDILEIITGADDTSVEIHKIDIQEKQEKSINVKQWISNEGPMLNVLNIKSSNQALIQPFSREIMVINLDEIENNQYSNLSGQYPIYSSLIFEQKDQQNKFIFGNSDGNLNLISENSFIQNSVNIHTDVIFSILDISKNSLMTAGGDGKLVLLNSSGNKMSKVNAHEKAVRCIDKNENEIIVSASDDGEIKTWSIMNDTIKHINTFNSKKENPIIDLKWMKKSSLVMSVCHDSVDFWNGKKGTHMGAWHNKIGNPVSIVRSPDNYDMVVAYEDGHICLWTIKNRKKISSKPNSIMKLQKGMVSKMSFINSKLIATTHYTGELCIWNWKDLKRLAIFVWYSPLLSLYIQKETNTIITGSRYGETLILKLKIKMNGHYNG